MRKFAVLLLSALLVLSLCSCSSEKTNKNSLEEANKNSLENACKIADELVNEWHNEAYGGCIYKSEYIKEYDGFAVSIYMVSARYPSSVDTKDSADFVKTLMTQTIVDELYPKLVEVLNGYEVSIGFTLSDQNGKNTYSTVFDGEVEYYRD